MNIDIESFRIKIGEKTYQISEQKTETDNNLVITKLESTEPIKIHFGNQRTPKLDWVVIE